MLGYMRLELRRVFRDGGYLMMGLVLPIGLYLLVTKANHSNEPSWNPRPAPTNGRRARRSPARSAGTSRPATGNRRVTTPARAAGRTTPASTARTAHR